MWFWAVSFVLCLIIYRKLSDVNKYWKRKNVPQCPPLPLVGNFGPLLLQRISSPDLIQRLYNSFPNARYFGIYQFLVPTLIIKDPNLIKRIMVKEFDTFPEHATIISEDADPLFSGNILFMKGGEKWQRLRSVLSPAFTSLKLKAMYPLMVSCAKQFVEHYENTDGIATIEAKETFARYTNDVIGTTAFGIECNSFKDPNNIFYKMGKDTVAITFAGTIKIFMFNIIPSIMKQLKIPILPKHASNFFEKVVKEAMQLREDKKIERPDVIHLLVESRKGRMKYEENDNELDSSFAIIQESEIGKQQKFKFSDITDLDLVAQAVIFFLAGYDTSSTALSFALYELAINPDVQQKLQNEIDTILESTNSDIASYEDLIKMPYLDLVITETLRMWPPISFTDRRVVKPFTIEPEKPGEKPVHLDIGTVCFIPVHSIHMDPQYYPNPNKFDPERFNDANKHLIKPFTYLSFGAGPKSCIGSRFALLEVKLILFAIMSKFDVVPVSKTHIPMIKKKRGIFIAAEGGVWLGLKKRNK